PDGPFCALAFKIMADRHVGPQTYFRVYSGQLVTGDSVFNSSRLRRERIGRLLRMHANKREDVDRVSAGDIVAALGLKHTMTGDTLCAESRPVVLEAIRFPEPVITMSIEPQTIEVQ